MDTEKLRQLVEGIRDAVYQEAISDSYFDSPESIYWHREYERLVEELVWENEKK